MKNKPDEIVKRARRKRLKRRFRIGEREKEIITKIGIGAVVISSLALPNLALILKPFLKDESPSDIERLWQGLVRKKVVDLGGEQVNLSAKGKKLLAEIQFHEITIDKPLKWDGVWRLVSYDVPETQNRDRDDFRMTLKQWGFYQIQASLWVYPYECKEEVAVAAEHFEIAPFVIVMTTDVLPNEEEVEEFFEL